MKVSKDKIEVNMNVYDIPILVEALEEANKEIERLKEENKKYNKLIKSLNKDNHRLNNTINKLQKSWIEEIKQEIYQTKEMIKK